MGPKSPVGEVGLATRRGAEGGWGDSGELGAGDFSFSPSRVSALLEGSVGAAFPWAGAVESWFASSGCPKDSKSMAVTGGAGAEGDIDVLNGGGRAVPAKTRVGAVEPESNGLRF